MFHFGNFSDSGGSIHAVVRQVSLGKNKHSFTVVNYGSQDIDEIPNSPDGLYEPAFPRRHSTIKPIYRARRPSGISFRSDNQSHMLSNGSLESQKVSERVVSFCPANTTHLFLDLHNNNNYLKSAASAAPVDIEDATDKKINILEVIKRGKLFAKRKRNRMMNKNGDINLIYKNIDNRSLRFLQDMFTTLVDVKWRYLILIFVLAFLITWLGFALIWWIIAESDKPNNIFGLSTTENVTTIAEENNKQNCLDGVTTFSSALLFSVETQHTIGYGTRSVTHHCPLAITFVMLQSVIGVILSCVMTGLLFAKFSRPKRRKETILFSEKAVICERDGFRCLVFRVGDIRMSHMISVNIRAVLISSYQTKEGEQLPFYQHNLHVQSEAEDFFFMAWPIRAIHYIDECSPLWDLTEEMLLAANFEILVIFEGINSSTGQNTEIRTSYLPSEILWGHKLEPLLTDTQQDGRIAVDFTKFHYTLPITMSSKSAKEESELPDNQHKKSRQNVIYYTHG